jgi:hypothetical protein
MTLSAWKGYKVTEEFHFDTRPIKRTHPAKGSKLLLADGYAMYISARVFVWTELCRLPQQAIAEATVDTIAFIAELASDLNPLRDGSEKDEGFPRGARETKVARYKRWQLVVSGWNAIRKVVSFFGHVTRQASGWCETDSKHANPAAQQE